MSIEWTEQTWNPIVGCQKISEGCRNCYAERMAARIHYALSKNHSHTETFFAYNHVTRADPNSPTLRIAGWSGWTYLREQELQKPLKRKTPTTYFVCDIGDLFHCTVNDDMITQVFRIIALCPQHTFLLLTKRPQRMGQRLKHEMFAFFRDPLHGKQPELQELPFPNAYLGVSVEDQKTANERIPELLKTPAAGRFVSLEPLLEPIDLWSARYTCRDGAKIGAVTTWEGGVHQVILGGESGPGARPMHPDWARQVRDDCAAAEVPFFFKQWGAWLPCGPVMPDNPDAFEACEQCTGTTTSINGYCLERVGKKRAGRMLDGSTHDELIWSA